MNHILIQYKINCNMWYMVSSLFGFSWALPRLVKELLGWHGSFIGKKEEKKNWWFAPVHLMRFLWKKHNRVCFEGNGELRVGFK